MFLLQTCGPHLITFSIPLYETKYLWPICHIRKPGESSGPTVTPDPSTPHSRTWDSRIPCIYLQKSHVLRYQGYHVFLVICDLVTCSGCSSMWCQLPFIPLGSWGWPETSVTCYKKPLLLITPQNTHLPPKPSSEAAGDTRVGSGLSLCEPLSGLPHPPILGLLRMAHS